MENITATQKYLALLDTNLGINDHAEVLQIRDSGLKVTQDGKRWQGRLICWIREKISSLFSRMRTSNNQEIQNPAMKKFLEDVGSDESITKANVERINKKIKRLDKSGVPFRVKHLRKLQQYLGDKEVTLPAKIVRVTRGESDTNMLETAPNGLGARDGDKITVSISFLNIGGAEYDEAMAEISRTPENFYDNCLKQKVNSLGEEEAGFVATAEDDEKFHEAWLTAVDEKVSAAGETGVLRSQLTDISDGVILELCQEIAGKKKLEAAEINDFLNERDEGLYSKFSDTIEKHRIEINKPPATSKKQDIRTQIFEKMQKTSVYENGSRFSPKGVEEVFECAVLEYCHDNQGEFTFYEPNTNGFTDRV